ncbi:uncharacterized protein LOC130803251 [Amaranthus tricolor]|uniref:uncharacterized protein LOC130803251 n=1 Tax=Amaranthus tricolor TaxID=29722 RepID=UPI00258E2016|nr:uncharacterized protein LOC130803251 [Amaranthus tricolor]
MAVFLSSIPSFFHPSSSYAKLPSLSHKSLIFPLKPTLKNYSLLLNRHGFRCCVSSQEDSTDTVDERRIYEEDVEAAEIGDKKVWESVVNLTKFYKEAVLAGDYHTIAEIETAFCKLETEKNELVQKLATMTEEISSGKEKYIRLQADFDNFRKRYEKERLSVQNNAKGEVIESFLPMVDNFERAKQQIKPETDREKQIDTSYQGIYKQFVEVMRSLRVAAIATVGKPFDPSLHEAIARGESEEFKEGIVIQEFRRGFLLGDRLLRPAMVKVSSGPGKKKDTDAQPATAAVVDEH